MDDNLGADVAALKQQVRSIETSMSMIATQMGSITEELRTSRQPNYSLFMGAAVLAFGAVIYYGDLTKRPLDERSMRSEKEIAEIRNDQKEIKNSIVPRGEHEQIWLSFKQQDNNMQREIDEQTKALGGIYSPRDAILRFEQRLDSVQQELRSLKQKEN